MNIFYEIEPKLLDTSAVALGFFDGVHPGHQAVIKTAVAEAERMAVPAALVTFRDHPRTLTVGRAPLLLTTLEQRLDLVSALGIDTTLVLTFTEEICRMAPEEYVRTVLVESLGARSVSIGYNHRFGRNREGTPELLRQLGRRFGFSVHTASPVTLDGAEVSSSRVREALKAAEVDKASRLLGRPYAVRGTVVRGHSRGRSLGFPTANLAVCDIQLLPALGVYAGVTVLPDGRRLPSVINLGFRPTVSSDETLSVEVHILDFDQDLYGQTVDVEFWTHLRSERKFENVQALTEQISLDCRKARELLPGGSGEPMPA